MVDRPRTWSLPEFDNYLEDTLREMGRNRDVKTDAGSQPVYEVRAAGRTAEGNFRIDFTADLSGIGMPTNSPLAVIAGGSGPLAWFLGHVLVATTPRDQPPDRAVIPWDGTRYLKHIAQKSRHHHNIHTVSYSTG